MLRNRRDRLTLVYLAAMVVVLVYQWRQPGLCNPWVYPLDLLLGFSAAVISHNHNHVSTWRSRPLNLLTNYLLAIFYGHPVVAWIPTHNQNHHHFNNREGDLSRSPRLFRGNHLLSLVVYPPLTSLAQTRCIGTWIAGLRRTNRRLFWSAVSEYGVFFGSMALAFALDWRKAIVLLVIPQQFALFAIQSVNFWQHIECDADSAWDHSRNFVGHALNALLFDNGFHTVHHLRPGAHWSDLPALHAEHAAKIDPALNQPNAATWIFRTYFLPLVPFMGAPKAPTPASLAK